ncbi:NACHT domain-containing protein [Streptacidiphilus sp. PAMC 29251]
MDYALSGLTTGSFEQLTGALAKCVLGPGVAVFGDGKDGGREATFDGPVSFPFPDRQWDGYGVIQAKFRRRSAGDIPDAEWMERKVRAELKAWLDPASKRGRLPEYLLFTTNVVLSPVPDVGGIARVEAVIEEAASRLGLRGWAVWHYDEMCTYLDIHTDIRRNYAGFITPGDVLSNLLDTVPDAAAETTQLIRSHAGHELLAEQWVRLGQAGAQAERQRISLGAVAVDLEAEITEPGGSSAFMYAGRHVIERGDAVLRPSQLPADQVPHVVLIGGPGQGKSTLGQLICQVYRVALLDESGDALLTGEIREFLRSIRSDFGGIDLPMPRARRWPIRIALHDFANAILGGEDLSLLRFITRQVNKRSSSTVTDSQLKGWLRTWPWLLVLDGLDEVASPHTREDMMARISAFLLDARQLDADLLIVATTRPQGYHGEFHAGDYEQVQLVDMSTDDALHYAHRLAAARHHDDPDMRSTVLERTESAARAPATTRLMRSPLQVTIMSLLVERHARMPQNQYELFDAYYTIIYEREADKPGATGQLLADHKHHVHWLHQHVGLLLQSRAGQTGQLDAVMHEDELRERTYQRLVDETDNSAESQTLASQLITAATDRLVLLVAPDAGFIGFEVRSLQEYMAARALLSGPDNDIVPRLEALARSSSWHNTWLLAAAGLFTHHPHLRDALVSALREVDSRDEASMALAPGARLAVDLLAEELTRQQLRYHNLLVQHAATLIGMPPGWDLARIAGLLLDAAGRHPRARGIIEHEIKSALRAHDARLVTGLMILSHWSTASGPIVSAARQLLDATVRQLGAEERAAAILFSGEWDQVPALPGLPQFHPAALAGATLADYLRPHVATTLPQPQGAVVAAYLESLEEHQVHLEVVEGITVPVVEPSIPLDTAGAITAGGDPAIIATCTAALNAQTAIARTVAMTLYGLLAMADEMAASPDVPTVYGIS